MDVEQICSPIRREIINRIRLLQGIDLLQRVDSQEWTSLPTLKQQAIRFRAKQFAPLNRVVGVILDQSFPQAVKAQELESISLLIMLQDEFIEGHTFTICYPDDCNRIMSTHQNVLNQPHQRGLSNKEQNDSTSTVRFFPHQSIVKSITTSMDNQCLMLDNAEQSNPLAMQATIPSLSPFQHYYKTSTFPPQPIDAPTRPFHFSTSLPSTSSTNADNNQKSVSNSNLQENCTQSFSCLPQSVQEHYLSLKPPIAINPQPSNQLDANPTLVDLINSDCYQCFPIITFKLKAHGDSSRYYPYLHKPLDPTPYLAINPVIGSQFTQSNQSMDCSDHPRPLIPTRPPQSILNDNFDEESLLLGISSKQAQMLLQRELCEDVPISPSRRSCNDLDMFIAQQNVPTSLNQPDPHGLQPRLDQTGVSSNRHRDRNYNSTQISSNNNISTAFKNPHFQSLLSFFAPQIVKFVQFYKDNGTNHTFRAQGNGFGGSQQTKQLTTCVHVQSCVAKNTLYRLTHPSQHAMVMGDSTVDRCDQFNQSNKHQKPTLTTAASASSNTTSASSSRLPSFHSLQQHRNRDGPNKENHNVNTATYLSTNMSPARRPVQPLISKSSQRPQPITPHLARTNYGALGANSTNDTGLLVASKPIRKSKMQSGRGLNASPSNGKDPGGVLSMDSFYLTKNMNRKEIPGYQMLYGNAINQSKSKVHQIAETNNSTKDPVQPASTIAKTPSSKTRSRLLPTTNLMASLQKQSGQVGSIGTAKTIPTTTSAKSTMVTPFNLTRFNPQTHPFTPAFLKTPRIPFIPKQRNQLQFVVAAKPIASRDSTSAQAKAPSPTSDHHLHSQPYSSPNKPSITMTMAEQSEDLNSCPSEFSTALLQSNSPDCEPYNPNSNLNSQIITSLRNSPLQSHHLAPPAPTTTVFQESTQMFKQPPTQGARRVVSLTNAPNRPEDHFFALVQTGTAKPEVFDAMLQWEQDELERIERQNDPDQQNNSNDLKNASTNSKSKFISNIHQTYMIQQHHDVLKQHPGGSYQPELVCLALSISPSELIGTLEHLGF